MLGAINELNLPLAASAVNNVNKTINLLKNLELQILFFLHMVLVLSVFLIRIDFDRDHLSGRDQLSYHFIIFPFLTIRLLHMDQVRNLALRK